jgi:L-lysine 6-transaminase
VRAARYLQIMVEDRLVENAERVGERFLEGLQELAARVPEVTNPRGRGFMLAFDLPDPAARDAVRADLWSTGLAALACGTRSIRFRPPLIFGETEVERALDILDRVLAERLARA